MFWNMLNHAVLTQRNLDMSPMADTTALAESFPEKRRSSTGSTCLQRSWRREDYPVNEPGAACGVLRKGINARTPIGSVAWNGSP